MSEDLRTTYLGLDLRNPLVASASPLTGRLEFLHQMEEAGAAAVVMPSLFEEQLARDERAVRRYFELGLDAFARTVAEVPELDVYNGGPANYLRAIAQAKKTLAIPVIASLNGRGAGDWARHAQLVEEAGADAVELNIYFVPTDPAATALQVEQRYLDLVAAVRDAVKIPLAVKLGPYFSSLPNLARRLVEVGADGLVLFNRFLQPDVDLETLRISPTVALTASMDLRVPLRWIAILRSQLSISLAASSGIHTSSDVVKLLLAGADATMTTSALLRHGPGHFRNLLDGLLSWMRAKGHGSIKEIQGSLSLRNCPDPEAFERANYVTMIAVAPYTLDDLPG
jgi:dihydroorotate dehydrogenase (fumarate)